jgi:hypothetical protein
MVAKYLPFGERDPLVIAESHQKCSMGIFLFALTSTDVKDANKIIGNIRFFINIPFLCIFFTNKHYLTIS